MTADTSAIPLNKLTTWPGNIGKTGADTGLAGLAAVLSLKYSCCGSPLKFVNGSTA